MCSFLFLKTARRPDDHILREANRIASDRGPDATDVVFLEDASGNSLTFLHNLLDISGGTHHQPVVSGETGNRLLLLFNGEIYNFSELSNVSADTLCILPGYEQNQEVLGSKMDGEFAALLYDERQQSVTLFVDPFMTKPVYFGWSESGSDFGIATCASSLTGCRLNRVEMARPNSVYRFRLLSQRAVMEERNDIHGFDLTQHKTNYEDWISAFLTAVEKRARHGAHQPIVFLSSGYDSGAICLALNLLGIAYDTMTIEAGEDRKIIADRINQNRKASCRQAFRFAGLNDTQRFRIADDIQTRVEPFQYQHEDLPGHVSTLQTDGGALGAWFLAEQARNVNRLINLSGSGADEILSDYGIAGRKIYHHSEFGGLFPEDLEAFFPWRKFYDDTQRSYLFKDEYILGRHGIEGRYPFLDKRVVQEFLWLTPQLKNAAYKAPLDYFLRKHDYPFEVETKRGFCPADRRTLVQKILQTFSLR